MTASTRDPLIGTVLGGCQVEAVIGRGGMGAVYRARHLALDKTVAVKLLAPHLSGDKDYIGRFVHEARAAARIDHPHVVQVLNVSCDDDRYFIVMAFVEGESVEDVLRRQGRLPLERATRILRDVAAGLSALHREGIIHRDIKPANILVARDGGVKITDFGLARSVTQTTGFTTEGNFMGTPEYASPEQAEGREIDPRSDLYSLGVTYFQMLSGLLPFQGRSAVDVAAKHLRDEPPPILDLVPGLDPRAAAVVHRLMQKEPADRYGSAEVLVGELDRLLGDGPVEAPPAPAPSPQSMEIATAPTVPTPRPALASGEGSNLPFWVLLLVFWGVSFFVGVRAAGHRGEGGGVESLLRPFLASDEGVILRITLAILAGVSFLAAFLWRRPFEGSFLGGALALLTGACLYAGAAGSAPGSVFRQMLESRSDASQFGLVGAWALLMGLRLVSAGGSTRAWRGIGFLLALLGLPLLAAFASGEAAPSVAGRVVSDVGSLLIAAATLASAVLGLFLSAGRGAARVSGILLTLLASGGACLVGSLAARSSLGGRLLRLPQDLIEHQGFLTLAVLLALGSVWVLAKGRKPVASSK